VLMENMTEMLKPSLSVIMENGLNTSLYQRSLMMKYVRNDSRRFLPERGCMPDGAIANKQGMKAEEWVDDVMHYGAPIKPLVPCIFDDELAPVSEERTPPKTQISSTRHPCWYRLYSKKGEGDWLYKINGVQHHLEVRSQDSAGSVQEKLPHLVQDSFTSPHEVVILVVIFSDKKAEKSATLAAMSWARKMLETEDYSRIHQHLNMRLPKKTIWLFDAKQFQQWVSNNYIFSDSIGTYRKVDGYEPM